jgi:hypothetical protein
MTEGNHHVTAPALSASQLQDALGLAAESDSVELKLTIPDANQRSTVAALELDPLTAQIRQVFFFDTPDLACNAVGVVVRARRVQARGDDSVVKLRPVVPDQLSPELRKSPDLVVEVDAMPGGYVCSASLKHALKKPYVRSAVMGEKPISKLFSKQQRAFFAEHAPDGVQLESLAVLGPIFVLKVKFAPKDYKGRIVAELWLYPDGSRILELSTKCSPGETMEVATRTRGFLENRGIDLSGDQQTKTKTALEFYANDLKAASAAPAA